MCARLTAAPHTDRVSLSSGVLETSATAYPNVLREAEVARGVVCTIDRSEPFSALPFPFRIWPCARVNCIFYMFHVPYHPWLA